MTTVAFYGAGMLGTGFVTAMRGRGLDVHVWNRSFEKAKALESVGARAFDDPAQAARGADYVQLCLSDDAAVDATLAAALPGIGSDAIVIDHTTVSPEGVRARHDLLAQAHRAFLHAPVFMGPPNTYDATGVMMCSGAHDAFTRASEHLDAMTGELRYFGERIDLAAIYKLMGNAMILAVVGGLDDMFRIGEAGGVSREDAYELFSFFSPAGQIDGRGKRMAVGDDTVTWTLSMARKDARLMQAYAHAPLPVIDAIARSLDTCITNGLGTEDLTAISRRNPSIPLQQPEM